MPSLPRVLGGLQYAEARTAGSRVDHVGALIELGLGELAGLTGSFQASGVVPV